MTSHEIGVVAASIGYRPFTPGEWRRLIAPHELCEAADALIDAGMTFAEVCAFVARSLQYRCPTCGGARHYIGIAESFTESRLIRFCASCWDEKVEQQWSKALGRGAPVIGKYSLVPVPSDVAVIGGKVVA